MNRQDTSTLTRIEALTRREFMFSALGAALLIACGGDEDEAAPSPTATPVSDGFPRTVKHYKGETVIPAKPERIVAATDLFELDNLLAMNVKPELYGYSNRYETGMTPWAKAAGAEGVEKYDWAGEMDLERIAAANPDLIIAEWYWGGEESYDLLAPIAPTVVLPKADTDATGWRLPQRVAGKACGTEDAAEKAITDTEAVLSQQKQRLVPYANHVVTIAYGLYDGNWFADVSDGASGRLLNDLGMKLAAVGEDKNQPVSAEQLSLLQDTDILISYDTGVDAMAAWEASPLLRALPAVQEGRYVVVSPEVLRAVFSPTTLSVRWAAPSLVDSIIQAAEGKGKKLS
jgi:iron complex transport system substrate-binding protein